MRCCACDDAVLVGSLHSTIFTRREPPEQGCALGHPQAWRGGMSCSFSCWRVSAEVQHQAAHLYSPSFQADNSSGHGQQGGHSMGGETPRAAWVPAAVKEEGARS
ncbi:unnamed protein product [Ectocarpus sp. 12 AP-2014]